MKPVILYRGDSFEQEELEIASKYFYCTNRRPNIKENNLVIGRYSLWPFYSEQEKDIEYVGAKLINSSHQYRYIADLKNYVFDLKELTPRTWDNLQDLPNNISFVLKGETNSRKSNWKQDMFAVDKKAAIEVHGRLSNDSLIGYQNIYIREYVPLVKYMDGINGMPVTKEFRFFVAYGKVLCGDYYWQNYIDDLPNKPDMNEVPQSFLQEVIHRVGNNSNFYVIDVGQKISGEWIVIELNDGQQAGIPGTNCVEGLYLNLLKTIGEVI